MHFTQSIDGCLDKTIGVHGLPAARLAHWLDALTPGFKALQAKALSGAFPHFRIIDDTADLDEAKAALAKLCAGAQTLVVLGTGGSSLGGQALAQLGGWFIPGDNGGSTEKLRPRIRFYDNLDARSFSHGLDILDLAATRFLVISKSGNTAETLAQMLTVLARLDAQGLMDQAGRLFLAVSDPRDGGANGLRDVCERFGIPVLAHPPGIGGRYSGFSVVGLLPLLARGLDPYAVRAGAKSVIEALKSASGPQDFAPALGAAVSIGLAKDKGITTTVMFPYADRLERFAAWYVQLWAESLGKNGEGTTPLATLGPVDQHSQLQLFLDGPRQHMMTVLRVREDGPLPVIPADLAALAGAPYLGGVTIGDLVEAQSGAIAAAFQEAQRPLRLIELSRLDEQAMGGLMMHFMMETILAASLLDVNPFDQPAVELGKRIAREYLAKRPGAGHAGTSTATDGHQPHRGG